MRGEKMKNKFRYNKKRKHYSYIFKIVNGFCLNILLTTQPESIHKKHGKIIKIRNIKLHMHPNHRRSNTIVFIYNHQPYIDAIESFDCKQLDWEWDVNDKRKVKRFKKYWIYKKIFWSK